LAFFILFAIEIVIRLAAEQRQFYCGPNRYWNAFESVCLVSMAIDIVNPEELSVAGDVAALRLLGMLRILRTARAVRIFQFLKPLRVMLFSVVSCMVSMMWAILLLVLFIWNFALFLEDSAVAHLKELRRIQKLDPDVPVDPDDPVGKNLNEN